MNDLFVIVYCCHILIVVDADIACHYKRSPMHLFAYRVHTHRLGKSNIEISNAEQKNVDLATYFVKYISLLMYIDIL